MSAEKSHGHGSKFDPERLFYAFKACLIKSSDSSGTIDDISMKDYLVAYEEFSKFLGSLGSIFYFVITDVNEKLGILNNYLSKHDRKKN